MMNLEVLGCDVRVRPVQEIWSVVYILVVEEVVGEVECSETDEDVQSLDQKIPHHAHAQMVEWVHFVVEVVST